MGVAAALDLQAASESGTSRTQSDICKVANVSEVTLRGLLRILTDYSLNSEKRLNNDTRTLNSRKLVAVNMGFKAKARKHRKDNPNTDMDNEKNPTKAT